MIFMDTYSIVDQQILYLYRRKLLVNDAAGLGHDLYCFTLQ